MKKGNIIYKELVKYLISCKDKLREASAEEQSKIIEDIYLRLKIDSLVLFSDQNEKYRKVFDLLLECEKLLKIPNFSLNKPEIIKPRMICSHEDLLNYIVYMVRRKIHDEDLTGCCYIKSHEVYNECRNMGIKCKIIKIDPGFSFEGDLYHGKGFHYFNIVEIDKQCYIMDLSYKQFFKQDSANLLFRLGVVHIAPCLPGVYMTANEDRLSVAQELLKTGWIKIEKNTLKNYLDGFALSYRNGLFYEKIGEVNYETPYTDEDYYNFLTGKDNQFNHEPKECLGYQRKPLKNPYMNFKLK